MKQLSLKSILTLTVVIALIIFVGALLVMLHLEKMLTTDIAIMIITAFVLFATNIANYYFTRNDKSSTGEGE